eukprot:355040-Chlamydomonas_euryale.AAC.13
MIDSRGAGGTERGDDPGAPLLQTVRRRVHMGDLLTACRLADVLIHVSRRNDSRRNAATQQRPAPKSGPCRPRCP